MSLWTIGKGDISFWRANWLGDAIDTSNQSTITVAKRLHDYNFLRSALSPEQLSRAMAVVLDETKVDEIVFTLTPSGKFAIGPYLTAIRQL